MSICKLSSRAIRYIAEERYHEGIGLLRQALTRLLSSCDNDNKFRSLPPKDQLDLERGIVLFSIPLDSLSPLMNKHFQSSQDDTCFKVYDSIFQLLPVDEYNHNCSKTPSSIIHSPLELSAALIFNLALCYHIMTMVDARSQAGNTEKALRLYGMGLELLHREEKFDILLSLSLLNNMAHLYTYFYKAEEMEECYRLLFHMLDSDWVEESVADFYIFQLNVMTATITKSRAAGAA